MSMKDFTRSFAVVIGINEYTDANYKPLNAAKEDAKKMAKILYEDYKYNHVFLLTDDTDEEYINVNEQKSTVNHNQYQPTKTGLENLLTKRLPSKNLTETDRLLFFFAGHGEAETSNFSDPKFWIVPQGADIKNRKNTCLSHTEFYDYLTQLPCHHLLVILDCCYAGAFTFSSRPGKTRPEPPLYSETYKYYIEHRAWQVITSTTHTQSADDHLENTRHSPFAEALFKGLGGKADTNPPAEGNTPAGDGIITVNELYQYLFDEVSRTTSGKQTPGQWRISNLPKKNEHSNKNNENNWGMYVFLRSDNPKLKKAPPLEEKHNPYQGLNTFNEEDAQFFLGREELIEKLYNKISISAQSSSQLTVVLGDSGAGKSSLVKAGLIPYLRNLSNKKDTEKEEWYILEPMRPGESPFNELAKSIISLPVDDVLNKVTAEKLKKLSFIQNKLDEKKADLEKNRQNESQIERVQKEYKKFEYLCEEFKKLSQDTTSDNDKLRTNLLVENYATLSKLLRNNDANNYQESEQQESQEQQQLRETVFQSLDSLSNKLKEELDFFKKILEEWINEKTNSKAKFLLVIDQFEELITLNRNIKEDENNNEQTKFLSLLERTLEANIPEFHIVVTLRSDLEPEFLKSEHLKSRWADAQFSVQQMRSDELRQAIEEPAKLMGLQFKPPELVDWLIEEVTNMPGRLPLLSFTLSELYIQLYKEFRANPNNCDRALKLKKEEFKKGAGVIGFLIRKADEVYEAPSKTKEYKDTLRRVMLRMVTIDGGEPTRRRVPLFELRYPYKEEDDRVKDVLNNLTTARLIVYGSNSNGQPHIEPAHDALISTWIKVKEWIKEDKQSLLLRQQLTPEANRWNDVIKNQNKNQNSSNFLAIMPSRWVTFLDKIEGFIIDTYQTWQRKKQSKNFNLIKIIPQKASLYFFCSGMAEIKNKESRLFLWNNNSNLKDLDQVLDSDNCWLNQIEADFVRQSFIQEGRATYRNYFWFVLIVVVGSALIWGLLSNRQQKKIEQIRTFQQSAEANLKSNRDLEAAIDILQATKNLKGSSFWGLFKPNKELEQVRETLSKVLYTVRERNRLQLDRGSVYQVAFNPKRNLVATVEGRGSVRLWDTSKPKQPKQIQLFSAETKKLVYSLAFTNDGKQLATGAGDGTVKLWKINENNTVDTASGKEILTSEQRQRQQQIIRDVEFTSDNKFLVTINEDNKGKRTIKLWDRVAQNKNYISQLFNFLPFDNPFSSFQDNWQFKPSKTTLNTQSCDQLNKGENIYDVAFSPNNKLLGIVGERDRVMLWDIDSKECSQKSTGQKNVYSVAFKDNTKLATGGQDNTIKLWNIKHSKFDGNPEQLLSLKSQQQPKQSEYIYSMAFSSDSKQLATLGKDYTVKLLETSNYQEIGKIEPLEGSIEDITVKSVAFSPNGEKLATIAGNGTVRLWNAKSGESINLPTSKGNLFSTDREDVKSVAFSPEVERQFLAIATKDGGVSLWDTSGQQHDYTLTRPMPIESIMFTSDGSQLIAVYEDGVARIIDIDKNSINFKRENNSLFIKEYLTSLGFIESLAYSPTIGQWATLVKGGSMVNLSDQSGKLLKQIPMQPNSIAIDLAFSPDGEVLAIGGKRGTVTLLNKLGDPINQFQTQQENINSLAFHPHNAKLLAIGGDDGTVRLLDISSNKPAPSPAYKGDVKSVAFSRDGKVLAIIGENSTVKLSNIEDDGNIRQKNTSNLELDKRRINLVEFSPKNNQLATVEDDDIVRLWDISGKKLDPMEIKTGQKNIDLVAFSLEGNLLATRGKDEGTIKLWDFKDDKFVPRSILNTDFDKFQKQQKIYSVAFSTDGARMATTSRENDNAQLWDTSGKNLGEFPIQQESAFVAFSPDSKQLATGGKDGKIKLWDTQGNLLNQFPTRQQIIYSIVFSPDGNKLVTIGSSEKEENLIKLWDTSGNELKQFEMQQEAIKRVKFSPNRKQLATFGTDGQVRVWQVGEVEELMQQICYLVQDYLQENPNLDESDKHLCDDVNKQKPIFNQQKQTTTIADETPVPTVTNPNNQAQNVPSPTPLSNNGQDAPSSSAPANAPVHHQNVPSPTPSSNNRQNNYRQAPSDRTQANQFNSTSVETYINQGLTYHRQRNYQQAISNYSKAITLKPNSDKAYSNRAAAYNEQKDYQKAIADSSKAISLNPNYANAYINRGLAYYYQGKSQQAIADYTKAIKLAPSNANAYNNRALAYTRLGNPQAAQADKRKAAALSQRQLR